MNIAEMFPMFCEQTLITDLYVVINAQSISHYVKFVDANITDQTVDEFLYRWNNYKENNKKSLRGDGHKQAKFFYHIQSSDHNGFLKDTDITFLDKTDPSNASSREDFWIRTLKTRYHLTLTQTHIVSECFRIFTSHYCIYEKRNFFIIWKKQGTWEVARYAYLFIYLFIYLLVSLLLL